MMREPLRCKSKHTDVTNVLRSVLSRVVGAPAIDDAASLRLEQTDRCDSQIPPIKISLKWMFAGACPASPSVTNCVGAFSVI
jgi:hypothetical protein